MLSPYAFLTHDETPGPEMRFEFSVEQDGTTITTTSNHINGKKTGFTQFVWPEAPDRFDGYGGVRWEAPANMRLKIIMTTAGGTPAEGIAAWGAELVTPETETSCHYFWSFARNFRLDEPGFDEILSSAIGGVFENEDGTMIAKVQANMGSETDLIALRPVVLPTDNAAIRARRVMQALLKKEELEGTGPES
ncbi:hypothetical protein SBA_ch1_26960 [Sphingomonas bisphenolicum]|uniref:Vanillate O-demethylase oxygenase-like C-terminal catalytic domain-containing protein n=1 Tax=Sphingomonas bisphenolicum TaxID=296544 RepID=A0ABN5WDV9_9SPHN|nr:hypothetical protein SBA_ch1_26960 [Sphingomonas bisphenolicum]